MREPAHCAFPHFSKLFTSPNARAPWHISSVTTGMTNNSRYQISSRCGGPNVLPKFGKTSRWNILKEKIRLQITLLVEPTDPCLTSLAESSIGKDSYVKPARISSRHGSAANSMPASAFNSQLG
jgi:hypothetical protein